MSMNTNLHASSSMLPAPPSSSFLFRAAVRMCRTKWYAFLRRVYRYQNDSTTSPHLVESNPFNSPTWILLEFLSLLLQIALISFTLPPISSSTRHPLPWPIIIWMLAYQLACLLSLPLLYFRWRWHCRYHHQPQPQPQPQPQYAAASEEGSSNRHSSTSQLMNKWRSCLELFFAVWFAVGVVWTFSRGSRRTSASPKRQHLLYISLLLAWNGISYSFTFLLFLFFCCCIPLLSNHIGHNITSSDRDRGAIEDEISRLPSWRYNKQVHHVNVKDEPAKCSICLARYRDMEEMRQLPCSHVFHLNCVDIWLVIAAYCPLCKQELERC